MDEQICKKEYDDWIETLHKRHAESLLNDPYNIWLEAWSVSEILVRNALLPMKETKQH